ncbi:MAG TPA: sensor histidine kinase [Bryobacteraceae bacterium]|nr:sensor histidine kinase [Bryobacteraceae bacterium]
MWEQILEPAARPENDADALVQELEAERERLGRELHAGVGQPLAGIRMNLEILDACAASLPEAAAAALDRLHRLADEALEQTRALAHRLHPPAWQQLPLAAALRQLFENSGIEAALDFDTALREPAHSVRVALYRCAQECLSNVIRHSGATRVEVSLRMAGSRMELAVADNGHGMIEAGNGIGIASIRERAGELGGSATITSNQRGTTVVVSIPADSE